MLLDDLHCCDAFRRRVCHVGKWFDVELSNPGGAQKLHWSVIVSVRQCWIIEDWC